jgi:tripartite-type tricarboxylate transporter receptor subunit TctC
LHQFRNANPIWKASCNEIIPSGQHTRGTTLAVQDAPTTLAQTYPERPIRIVDGFPAGGAADYLARVLGPS